MTPPDDLTDPEEVRVHGWFAALRKVMPAPKRDLPMSVMEQLDGLQDDERLKGPALEKVLGGLLTEALNAVSRFLNGDKDNGPKNSSREE